MKPNWRDFVVITTEGKWALNPSEVTRLEDFFDSLDKTTLKAMEARYIDIANKMDPDTLKTEDGMRSAQLVFRKSAESGLINDAGYGVDAHAKLYVTNRRNNAIDVNLDQEIVYHISNGAKIEQESPSLDALLHHEIAHYIDNGNSLTFRTNQGNTPYTSPRQLYNDLDDVALKGGLNTKEREELFANIKASIRAVDGKMIITENGFTNIAPYIADIIEEVKDNVPPKLMPAVAEYITQGRMLSLSDANNNLYREHAAVLIENNVDDARQHYAANAINFNDPERDYAHIQNLNAHFNNNINTSATRAEYIEAMVYQETIDDGMLDKNEKQLVENFAKLLGGKVKFSDKKGVEDDTTHITVKGISGNDSDTKTPLKTPFQSSESHKER